MKNIMLAVGMVVLVSVVGCSSSKDVEQDVTASGEKTIGQQLDEAGASLKDCRKNCEQAATPQRRQECRQACKYARAMHKMAREMTRGVSDKTQSEIGHDFQKNIYGNMNEKQLAKIKALQAQGRIPQNLTVGAEGAKSGVEP